MAIRLLERGITSFTIYEKSDGVGGTWRDNTYPGAACDVPRTCTASRSLPRPTGPASSPSSPRSSSYFESLVDRFGLGPHLRFGVAITAATWDDDEAVAPAATSEGSRSRSSTSRSSSAGSASSTARTSPTSPGSSPSRGRCSTRPAGTTTTTCGASASRSSASARARSSSCRGSAAEARQLTLFQRSVNYVAPKPDRRFRPWEHWLLEHVGPLQRLYRAVDLLAVRGPVHAHAAREPLGAMLQKTVRASSSPAMVSAGSAAPRRSIPDYTPGCRRILIANDWYPTLLRPNSSVVTDGDRAGHADTAWSRPPERRSTSTRSSSGPASTHRVPVAAAHHRARRDST